MQVIAQDSTELTSSSQDIIQMTLGFCQKTKKILKACERNIFVNNLKALNHFFQKGEISVYV